MAAQGLDCRLRDAVLPTQLEQVAAQTGPFPLPAADADVDVVSLGEHPAVAAGDRAELEDGTPSIPSLDDRLARDVPLERDGEHVVAAEPEAVTHAPVDAVRADEHAALDAAAVHADRDGRPGGLDVGHLHAVTHVGARGSSLLEEVLVETDALRHLDQRSLAETFEAHPVPETKADAVDDVLDDRLDGDGKLADGAHRQPAAARLVAREARLVDDEHARSRAGQVDSGYRACRAGTDDDGVEALQGFRIVCLLQHRGRGRG